MAVPPQPNKDLRAADDAADYDPARIYLLPNLMTAGNLFCGFVAVIRCIQALFVIRVGEAEFLETAARLPSELYEQAVWFILAAVVFDALDGRMARLTGKDSLFGKEFDSLADIVSFGVAPALLVFFFLLNPGQDFPLVRTLGGLVGFVYLLCAAVRLARFNVITSVPSPAQTEVGSDFQGLPVPAAAGMVSSLVLMINRLEHEFDFLALFLPVLLVVISLLMISSIRYPSFKKIGARTYLGFRTFILVFVIGTAVWLFHYIAVACLFFGYIMYGIVAWIRERRRLRVADKA